jgi:hypothetical protein
LGIFHEEPAKRVISYQKPDRQSISLNSVSACKTDHPRRMALVDAKKSGIYNAAWSQEASGLDGYIMDIHGNS